MPLDSRIRDRFSRLLSVQLDERAKQFREDLRRMDAQSSAKGMFNSGAHFYAVKQAHERELELRTVMAWQSLVRAFESAGGPIADDVVKSFKHELHESIDNFARQLGGSFKTYVDRLPAAARAGDHGLDGFRHHLIRSMMWKSKSMGTP